MRIMNNPCFTLSRRISVATVSLTLACGCAALRPAATPNPAFYSLDSARFAARAETKSAVHSPVPASSAKPTLIVNPPYTAAGFDSPRIIYVREAHKLEYYAHSEWVDTPARMLAPLIVAAAENSGAFRAVVRTPSAAAGDLRLDTEIMRLQHEFTGPSSRVRFSLRAYLVDNPTRRVLAWREFDAVVPAPSEDPYGGVVAANQAVHTVLESLAAFCAETARGARLTP